MANIANRIIKRFHQGKSQVTFGYAHDSEATTLLIMTNLPSGTWASLALDKRQATELSRWLQEQLTPGLQLSEENL